MKKFLILATAVALAFPAFAADKAPAKKPAATKKAEKAPKKVHPKYEHKKAPKQKVPARDNSKMPTPAGGPGK